MPKELAIPVSVLASSVKNNYNTKRGCENEGFFFTIKGEILQTS